MCDGIVGSSFSYVADLNHDGHRTETTEVIAQGGALYAIEYRRPVGEADDAQALRTLHSLCPSKTEPLPTAPPFVIPAAFSKYSPPHGFQRIGGRTENSIGWTRQTPEGISVIVLRHLPTFYATLQQYDDERRLLAKGGASTLDGFHDYELLADGPRRICAAHPVGGWYTEIRSSYAGTPAIAKQFLFIAGQTLYSVGYLRALSAPEDPRAVASLQTFCPRLSASALAAERAGHAAVYAFGDFIADFDVAYSVRLQPAPRNHAPTEVGLALSGSASGATMSIALDRIPGASASLNVVARASTPAQRPKSVRDAIHCATSCRLELVAVDALVNDTQIARWPRGRYPAWPTRVEVFANIAQVGDSVAARFRAVRAIAGGKHIPTPSCGLGAKGMEPGVVGSEIVLAGSFLRSAPIAFRNLRRSRPTIDCRAASDASLASGGVVGARPHFVVRGVRFGTRGSRDLVMLMFADGGAMNGTTI